MLFVAPAVGAVFEALGAAAGNVAVIGHAKLATALGDAKRDGVTVVPVGLSPRAAKKLTNALADLSAIEDRSLAAVVAVDVASDDGWELALRDWRRVVRDGGTIVMVDRGRAPEASRRALCAGLGQLEQRRAGRVVVTSGMVSHF
ncbi:MAG TPA: hypothetical protein VGF94_11400 [Kofleriaceae bacterium]|jgi:hypothetical protein